jgi:hypothetical protein
MIRFRSQLLKRSQSGDDLWLQCLDYSELYELKGRNSHAKSATIFQRWDVEVHSLPQRMHDNSSN